MPFNPTTEDRLIRMECYMGLAEPPEHWNINKTKIAWVANARKITEEAALAILIKDFGCVDYNTDNTNEEHLSLVQAANITKTE